MRKILFLLLCFCGQLLAEPTRLYFVRHGETDWNLEKRVQGQSDIPLNATGRKQAEQLKGQLDAIAFDACVASDLQRATETARILTQGRSLAIATDARLREYSFGALEGRLAWELTKEDYRALAEAQDAMQERVFASLHSIVEQHPGETVLVVTHGGVIRNILVRLSVCEEARIKNMGMVCLEIEGDQWRIKELQGIEIIGSFR